MVEVALAGAIAVMVVLALLETIIVSTKIAHENSELLAADAYAFDTAWKWLNKKWEDLPALTAGQVYSTGSSSYKIQVAKDECPVLSKAATGGDMAVWVKVTLKKDGSAVPRNGTTVEAKLIEVDVAWGPPGDRKSLNGQAENGTKNYNHPVSLYRCSVDRGTEDWL